MKLTMKRSLWTYDETLEMLNIMMEQESLKAMNGRPFRKDKAFRLIQEEMAQRGYLTKDAKQIEYRWKNIKKRYVDILKDPTEADDARFQYYDEIDLLLKGKSTNSTEMDGLCSAYMDKNRKTRKLVQEHRNEPVVSSTEQTSNLRATSEANRSKGEAKNESELHERNDPNDTSLDDPVCEDVAMEEEVVEATPEETSDATRRRSQRSTKGKSRRYNVDTRRAPLSSAAATEDDVYRSQKKLVDYQFGLYSRVQRDSDEHFLQMSRQMMEQCNMRFETFVTELLTKGDNRS